MAEQPAQRYQEAPTRTIAAADAVFAYRRYGQNTGIPLVVLTHLGANLDSWDPLVVNPLAEDREAIAVNYRGVGGSFGQIRASIEEMAGDMIAVIRALGFDRVHVFGLSMGGMVGQALAARDYLARLRERTSARDKHVTSAVYRAQLAPILLPQQLDKENNTMRAFVFDKYTGPLHEAHIPEPTVGDRDVLVRVVAAGLNQLDEKLRAGEFKQILPYKLPLTLGHDLAGTVVQVGAHVRDFKPGDEVYGRVRDGRIGTFAERIAVDESDLAPQPKTTSTAEAASLPLVALTAWQALVERGNVQSGQKLLIHAGAGGLGSIAIQLAKHLGAHVATTASGSNADFVRELGADIVIDYRTQDFEQELSGYDLVLDSLGGENLERSLRILKPGGKAIGVSGPPDPAFARNAGLNPIVRVAVTALSSKIRKQAKKLGVSYEFLLMRASGEELREITALVDAGIIRPIVGKTFPFDQTPLALTALARGGFHGKVVVTNP
ncbi:hypothetical protein GCM10022381_12100 [Leifsonia kafniensis]|uniref:Enoyl reductase (ER) domain-containing protein n=2 Tax=Leifsonia kafniensis TaxID=475957 RepID=A0ABP7KBJ1_9MICO